MKGYDPQKSWWPKFWLPTKANETELKKPRRYLLLLGGDVGPWNAYHMEPNATDMQIVQHIKDLQGHFPHLEVRLYLCEVDIKLNPSKEKPYKRIKKLKHIVKSSAEWIKEGERTAICSVCGGVGPSVSMNNAGNIALEKAGWYKEKTEQLGGSLYNMFGGGRREPEYVLRCPACDEQHANENIREDWF